ncbi:MAG: hypothetical protein KAW09_01420, partial [Thermoplasmata archaeon]|nr:hypothetical protein [Thermoplasmata archaeon]
TEGDVGVELILSEKNWKKEMVDALDFGEKLSKKRKRRMVIIFDEFQEIRNLDGLELEKLMRSRFQHHKHASYVFCGSKQHILSEMFSDEARALYKFAKPLLLGPMEPAVLESFIEKRFAGAGGSIAKEVSTRVAEIGGGNPYNTQRICYEIWSLSNKADDSAIVDEAIGQIVEHSTPEFELIWEQVRGLDQRRLLLAIAQEGRVSHGKDFIREHGLKTPGHVSKSLTLLQKKNLVDEKGSIADIFFSEWIKRRI